MKPQLSIRGLLLLTAAFAVLFAVLRVGQVPPLVALGVAGLLFAAGIAGIILVVLLARWMNRFHD